MFVRISSGIMQRPHLLFIFLFTICVGHFFVGVDAACKIAVKVRSGTKTPFKLKIIIPSVNAETEEVLFEYRGQQKQVTVDGVTCMGKPWVFRTFKQGNKGKWHVKKDHVAKLDGMGRMTVSIDDDLDPHIGERFAVFCSESVICG